MGPRYAKSLTARIDDYNDHLDNDLVNSTSAQDRAAARLLVTAHDTFIRAREPSKPVIADALTFDGLASWNTTPTQLAASYEIARAELVRREQKLAFDHPACSKATALELRASAIVAAARAHDDSTIFSPAPARIGYGGQRHKRFAGDHFLGNMDLIQQTSLLRIARHMPKGAHLHIHFNACLLPRVLLGIAAQTERMYIFSDVPLSQDTWDSCMLEFSVLAPGAEHIRPGNLFDPAYQSKQTMKLGDFLASFPQGQVGCPALTWLENKLTFGEAETHDVCQTSIG